MVLPYINMNPPRVYMCSQSWTPLPPPTAYHLSGSLPITTYVGHRRLSVLPKERRHWGLPGLILEAHAKLAGLVSTHVPDGNSARRGKNDTGESVFPETDPISLFSGLLIYFLLHIGMNTELWGVSRPDRCQNQVFHIKLYKGLRGFTSSYGHEACWHFMALSDNSQSTR